MAAITIDIEIRAKDEASAQLSSSMAANTKLAQDFGRAVGDALSFNNSAALERIKQINDALSIMAKNTLNVGAAINASLSGNFEKAAQNIRKSINESIKDLDRLMDKSNQAAKSQAQTPSASKPQTSGFSFQTNNPAAYLSKTTANQAAGVANQIVQSINTIPTAAKNAADSTSSFFSKIFGANILADLATSAIKGFLGGMKDLVVESALYASRTQELGLALEAVSNASGININVIKAQENAIKSLNITTQDARQTLSRFVAAELDITKASKLATAAQDLAVIGGKSTSEEINSLVIAIQTLQSRNLRSAGVFITVDEVLDKLAKTTGRARDSFSTLEKQQAVLNAVLQFSTRVTGTYDKAMDSAAKKMRSLERQAAEAQNAIGEKFGPALLLIVEIAGFLLDKMAEFPGLFLTLGSGITVLILGLTALNSEILVTAIAAIPKAVGATIAMIQQLAVLDLAMGATATTAEFLNLAIGSLFGVVGLVAVLGSVVYALYQWGAAGEAVVKVNESIINSQAATVKNAEADIASITRLIQVQDQLAVALTRVNNVAKDTTGPETRPNDTEGLIKPYDSSIPLKNDLEAQQLLTERQKIIKDLYNGNFDIINKTSDLRRTEAVNVENLAKSLGLENTAVNANNDLYETQLVTLRGIREEGLKKLSKSSDTTIAGLEKELNKRTELQKKKEDLAAQELELTKNSDAMAARLAEPGATDVDYYYNSNAQKALRDFNSAQQETDKQIKTSTESLGTYNLKLENLTDASGKSVESLAQEAKEHGNLTGSVEDFIFQGTKHNEVLTTMRTETDLTTAATISFSTALNNLKFPETDVLPPQVEFRARLENYKKSVDKFAEDFQKQVTDDKKTNRNDTFFYNFGEDPDGKRTRALALTAEQGKLKAIVDLYKKNYVPTLQDVGKTEAQMEQTQLDYFLQTSNLTEVQKNALIEGNKVRLEQESITKKITEAQREQNKEERKKSYAEKLSDDVKKAKEGLDSLLNSSSKNFNLRFEKEGIERHTKDLEQILNLQHELGKPLSIPSTAKTAEGARAIVVELERQKKISDAVKAIEQERANAIDNLAVAQKALTVSVVDAETRAQTIILQNIRERRNAEAQLTADIAVEIFKRRNMNELSADSLVTTQAEVYLDRQRGEAAALKDLAKSYFSLQLDLGDQTFKDNPLVKQGEEDAKKMEESVKQGDIQVLATRRTNEILESTIASRLDQANENSNQLGITLNTGQQAILNGLAGVTAAIQAAGLMGGGANGDATSNTEKGGMIVQAARLLGMSPQTLAGIIDFESGGSTSVTNSSGHTGLIQFGRAEQQTYGVNSQSTFAQQMAAVVQYFRDRGYRPGMSDTQAYNTVLGGNPNAQLTADSNGTTAVSGAMAQKQRQMEVNRKYGLIPTGTAVGSTTKPIPVVNVDVQGKKLELFNPQNKINDVNKVETAFSKVLAVQESERNELQESQARLIRELTEKGLVGNTTAKAQAITEIQNQASSVAGDKLENINRILSSDEFGVTVTNLKDLGNGTKGLQTAFYSLRELIANNKFRENIQTEQKRINERNNTGLATQGQQVGFQLDELELFGDEGKKTADAYYDEITKVLTSPDFKTKSDAQKEVILSNFKAMADGALERAKKTETLNQKEFNSDLYWFNLREQAAKDYAETIKTADQTADRNDENVRLRESDIQSEQHYTQMLRDEFNKRQTAYLDSQDDLKKATQETRAYQDTKPQDALKIWRDTEAARLRATVTTDKELLTAQAESASFFNNQVEERKNVWISMEADREKATVTTQRNIMKLEAELMAGEFGVADKLREKWLQLQEVRMHSDTEAKMSQLESIAKIEENSIESMDKIRAKVYEHAAAAQSVSDTIAGVFTDTFDGINTSVGKGIDKITKDLGTSGVVIGNMLKGVAKRISSQVETLLFDSIFGGAGKDVLDAMKPKSKEEQEKAMADVAKLATTNIDYLADSANKAADALQAIGTNDDFAGVSSPDALSNFFNNVDSVDSTDDTNSSQSILIKDANIQATRIQTQEIGRVTNATRSLSNGMNVTAGGLVSTVTRFAGGLGGILSSFGRGIGGFFRNLFGGGSSGGRKGSGGGGIASALNLGIPGFGGGGGGTSPFSLLGPGGTSGFAGSVGPLRGITGGGSGGGALAGLGSDLFGNHAAGRTGGAFGGFSTDFGFGRDNTLRRVASSSGQRSTNTTLGGIAGLGGQAGSTTLSGLGTRLGGRVSGLGLSFAKSAPLIGAGLGASLGGGSGIGGIVGGAGGLLAGAIGGAALTAALTSATLFGTAAAAGTAATSGTLATFGLGAIGGPIGLAIAAGVAGVLLLAGYLFGKKKRQKADIKAVNEAKGAALQQLQDLLKAVKSDKMDGADAVERALGIKAEFMELGKTLKTKKGREEHARQARDLDGMVSQIQSAAAAQEQRQKINEKLVPTYATGGVQMGELANVSRGETILSPAEVEMLGGRSALKAAGVPGYNRFKGGDSGSGFGLIPGQFDGRDDLMTKLPNGFTVLTPAQVRKMGGSVAMRKASVRGYSSGGVHGSVAPSNGVAYSPNSGNNGSNRPIVVVVVADEAMAATIVSQTPDAVIAGKTISHVEKTGSSGLAGVIGKALTQ